MTQFVGHSRSYGLEILAKKNKGRLTGWISYTLSKSQRKIGSINKGEWYNSPYDKTHDLSIVGNYQLASRWSVSGVFVYRTGNAYTQPINKYQLDGETVFEYGQKNGSRMKDYHRLDLNVTYESRNTKRFKSSWSFGVYNIYGNPNPYYANLAYNQGSGKVNLETQSFSLIPNISYNFKF